MFVDNINNEQANICQA